MQPMEWIKSPKLSVWSKMGRDSGDNAVTEAREKSFNGERVVNSINMV